MRSNEELLFRVIWNAGDTIWSHSVGLHCTHISVLVFLSVLNGIPVFILSIILLAALSSGCHREKKLTVSVVAALHQLVLVSVYVQTLVLRLSAALSDLHIGNLFVFLHESAQLLSITVRLNTILRNPDSFAISHIGRALLVALILTKST